MRLYFAQKHSPANSLLTHPTSHSEISQPHWVTTNEHSGGGKTRQSWFTWGEHDQGENEGIQVSKINWQMKHKTWHQQRGGYKFRILLTHLNYCISSFQVVRSGSTKHSLWILSNTVVPDAHAVHVSWKCARVVPHVTSEVNGSC